MAPANDAVFLRRNNQIQDAIDGQNLKQALQLIEKRMKKGEDTRFLKAWKAHVLFRMADEAHHQRGVTETLELCNAEPPTTDLDTLDILFKTLQQMDGQDEAKSSLWEKASKAKSQDHELQMRWFSYAFEGNDWKSAQKAAMSLQKNFPRERKFYFWAIFLSYLVANDDASSEMDKKLFGTLAYRMISKAAADVPADPDQLLSHPRAIQRSEELLLLIKIYESQKRFSEVVKILDSENIGLTSRIIQNDQDFVDLKAANLGASKMWDEGIAFVKELYTVPDDETKRKALAELDDWKFWNLLIESTRQSKAPGVTTETQNFIENFIEANPKSRNAALARLDVIVCGKQKGEMTSDDFFPACQKYLDQHKHKLYAFGDLRRVLNGNRDDMAKILSYMSEPEGEDSNALVARINALKMDYCLNIAGVEGADSKQKVEELVTRCMKLYHNSSQGQTEKTEQKADGASSTIESQPRDDLCILAAMSLLRKSESSETPARVSDTALIRAAAILERLVQDSPHNYQALLLLVRIYLMVGAGSLAFSTFSKMSIKQVQYDSVAHNFLTRLASIHPQSAPPVEGAERRDFDPQSAFVYGLNFFRSADITTSKFRTRGLDEGSYANVEEIVELGRRLGRSVCRRMWALEARRAQRLVGGDPLTRYDELARDASPPTDQRDFNAFMNCENVGQPEFEERMRLGPLPQENWLASARITDNLFAVLKGISIQRPLAPEMDLPALGSLTISEAENDHTDSEKQAATIHAELLKVATFMAGSNATSPEQAEGALSKVEDWLNSKKMEFTLTEARGSPFISATAVHFQLDSPIAPTWRFFHSVFTLIETLKALSQLVALASRKAPKATKLPKERVERLSTLMIEVFELIRSNVRALKQRISESGVLTSLTDLVVQGDQSNKYGKELQQTLETALDPSGIEIFCGSLMESWEESLDGVMTVKL